MKTTAAFCLLTLGTIWSVSAAQTITAWTFEGNVTTPSTGSGSAVLIGGTTATFADGHTSGRGWNTANYPAQGTGYETAGVQFNVSTLGYDLITISYDQAASARASRWSELQYTLNRNAVTPTWVTYSDNAGGLAPQDTFTVNFYNLSDVPGVDNNAAFAFRIVSVFSPVAFNPGVPVNQYGAFSAYHRAAPNSLSGAAYDPSGTWLFDNVMVSSSVIPVPEPATVSLILCGGLLAGYAGLRRRSR